jgi:hypothetical protein
MHAQREQHYLFSRFSSIAMGCFAGLVQLEWRVAALVQSAKYRCRSAGTGLQKKYRRKSVISQRPAKDIWRIRGATRPASATESF